MVEKYLTVKNKSGIHARPASTLVQAASKYPCKVTIYKGEQACDVKSILAVLKACITCGTDIRLVCDGEREQEALDALSAAIESGLGEGV